MKLKPYQQSLIALILSAVISIQTNAKITTTEIMSSSGSEQCLDYRVTGICYWLFCTQFGYSIKTSTKVRHFLPEQVVSSYNHGGQNPWQEVNSWGKGIKGGGYQDKPYTRVC